MENTFDEIEIEDPNLDALESDLDHAEKFMEGFESILKQYRKGNVIDYSGNEAYTVGVFKANGINWNVDKGFENFITDGFKKLMEMIKNMCKSIWNFFFGKGGDDTASSKEDVKTINKLEDKVEKMAKSDNVVLSESDINKSVAVGIDAAKANRSIPAPVKVTVTDAASAERNLVSECEHAYQVAAAEAYKDKEAKVKAKGQEISDLQPRMKKEGDAALRVVKEKKIIMEVNQAIEEEVKKHIGKTKTINTFVEKTSPALELLLKFEESSKEDNKDKLLISPQFCLPSGSYWYDFGTNFHMGKFDMKWFIEKFGDVLEGYVERYTKELEKAQANPDSVSQGLSEEEVMTMFNNSRRTLKALSEVTANVKSVSKRLKKIYYNALLKAEKNKAERVAAELAKLV